MIDLRIQGLAVLPPAHAASEGEPFKPDLTLLDRTLRRGLSEVTRLYFHVARGALEQAGGDGAQVQLVFASAYGEIGTAEAMLAQALDDNSASPARFRNSVHNTAPGLHSISARNTHASTALAAGADTLAMGLLESQLLLRESALPVLLVCADEAVPDALRHGPTLEPIAAAFVLGRGEGAGLARLRNLRRISGENSAKYASPLEGARALAEAVRAGVGGSVVVSAGAQPYSVDVDARES